MGKNKLRKFREMEQLERVFQFPFSVLRDNGGCPLKGRWHSDVFGNSNPLVLELGCGKGEYTVGLAQRFPDKNFIGIDIKGARMWTGGCRVRDLNLTNAAFLRTSIELLAEFFAPGEVSEIWITFPDPQMKKATKRLTGTRFMELYRKVLAPDGLVNLKTDSPFLYAYTRAMTAHNGLETVADIPDIDTDHSAPEELTAIRTYYESQWRDRGLTIKFLSWRPGTSTALSEPDVEIEPDTYRSFSRGELQMPQLLDKALQEK
ncbi:MAG: tRNA (guanosine(46)-N7)-methyltransferase TrmB [Bacteroides sp.]|nr:tRNA (guanosine(46)-N7)-methyltransferase TrmB [Bacteroides sp.]